MRGLLIFVAGIAGIAGIWAYVDRSWAVAAPAAGGPFVRSLAGCTPPAPSADAAVVFAGYYEGPAVSTVRLIADNPQEEGTRVVDVRIAPGFGQLYLVIAGSRNSIVRLSGWTRRLERVVLLGEDAYPIGVVGVGADKIAFASRRACGVDAGQFYEPERARDPSGLARRLGRSRPDAVGGAYQPRLLTISGGGVGAQSYATNEPDPGLEEWERIGARFVPGGVTEIDPGQLVANRRAEPYRTLPGWAGLGQLVRDGKIVARGSDRFRVVAPIDIPAGLSGAEAVTFELAPGVPRPRGDLGHSRISVPGLR